MNTIPAIERVPREGSGVPRFFAVILFSLVAFIGIPTASAALVYLTLGNWRTFLLLATVGPVVWVLVWLGRLLWSGRSIPGWFISAFYVGILAVPATQLLAKREWMEALALLGMCIPVLLQFTSAARLYPKKPVVLEEFDDFA